MPALSPLARAALVGVLLAPFGSAQLVVTSHVPADQDVGHAVADAISVTFAEPLATPLPPASIVVVGRWSGGVPGTVSLSTDARTLSFLPSRPLFAGERVTVTVAKGLPAQSGATLTNGHVFMFWAGSNPGTGWFFRTRTIEMRLPGQTGFLQTYGAFAGDLNGDGAPDLSLPQESGSDVRVVLNDGCGTFDAIPTVYPLSFNCRPSPNEGADFDGDGIMDYAVGCILSGEVTVFRGDGTGSFVTPPTSYVAGTDLHGMCVVDCDLDGDVDIVTANRGTSNLTVLVNDGTGSFAVGSSFDGGGDAETAVAAADANGDGILDLAVGNLDSSTVTFMLGDGAGGYTLAGTQLVPGKPWMVDVGDLDADGNVDIVAADADNRSATVAFGDGLGGFTGIQTFACGRFPIAVDFGDLNGDGHLDLVISAHSGGTYTVYMNDGTGALGSRVDLVANIAASCSLVVDFDRDGDVDIVAIDEIADLVYVFEQLDSVPAGAQTPSCDGTLRVNGNGYLTGFGGRPPLSAALDRLLLGITAAPNVSTWVLAGLDVQRGTASPWGLLNLNPIAILPLGSVQTDALGEAQLTFPVPTPAVSGTVVSFQGLVLDPAQPGGLRLTSPAAVQFR